MEIHILAVFRETDLLDYLIGEINVINTVPRLLFTYLLILGSIPVILLGLLTNTASIFLICVGYLWFL